MHGHRLPIASCHLALLPPDIQDTYISGAERREEKKIDGQLDGQKNSIEEEQAVVVVGS